MNFYRYDGLCVADAGGGVPDGAQPCDAPFAPLIFTVRRDPLRSRGLYAIGDVSQLDEPETPDLLGRLPQTLGSDELSRFVRRHGAGVLNTAFARAWPVLRQMRQPRRRGLRLQLVGLGDVGGTVLMGLALLGREIEQIGIFDPNEALCRRYELEMNQLLPPREGEPMPRIVRLTEAELFCDCDALLFTASLGVPPVSQRSGDVRMVQYTRNRELLASYSRMARQREFLGLFAQISDPVDHLCRAVFLQTNRDEAGAFDAAGLLPEQIQGYGLGVMHARAAFYAAGRNVDFTRGCVFGPHGQQLVVANDAADGYDEALSQQLTQDTVTANLAVRELGYKPYLAPGISSAAVSVLRTLRGEVYDGATALGGAYFGCRLRRTPLGVAPVRQKLHPALLQKLRQVHAALQEFAYDE